MNENEFGAIQTDTNEYVLPYKAEKNKNYKCIGCQQKLILKKGSIRKCHFAHYSDTNCFYFEHPNESDLHKEAKHKLAYWLKQKHKISIEWYCCKTGYNGKKCGEYNDGFLIKYEENDKVEIEYRDVNNKYIADIAVINNNKVKYIFEIKNTHSTITNVRPEPWFEINALEIVQNRDINETYLTCIRNNKNRYCYTCEILDEKWVHNLPRLIVRDGYENESFRDNPCINCGEPFYFPFVAPVFVNGYRQLCDICLCRHKEELKEKYSIHKPMGLLINLDTL